MRTLSGPPPSPRWRADPERLGRRHGPGVGRDERQRSPGPRGHEGDVRAAAFSPDGARIVSGSADDTIRVWDAASGEDLRVLGGHEGDVLAVALSPDGARIVSGSWDNTCGCGMRRAGEELLVLRGHEGNVWAADFSPDGARIVSGSDDQTVRSAWIGRSKEELSRPLAPGCRANSPRRNGGSSISTWNEPPRWALLPRLRIAPRPRDSDGGRSQPLSRCTRGRRRCRRDQRDRCVNEQAGKLKTTSGATPASRAR